LGVLCDFDVPVDEIPPPVLDAQEEEVAMEQQNKEFEVPQWLKDLPDYQAQGWRAFAHKRIDGHADGLSICFNQRYCLMTHTFLIADRGYMKSYLDEYHRQTSIIRHLTESTTVATSARTPFVVPRSPCTGELLAHLHTHTRARARAHTHTHTHLARGRR